VPLRVPNYFTIDTGATGIVTGLHYAAVKDEHLATKTTLILAHGAGAPQVSPFMQQFSEGMARRGIDTVTFNFAYMEQGRRIPDPKTQLEATYRSAIAATLTAVASTTTQLVIGGKSMGGRIASQVAASVDTPVDVQGLIFLGYPLHPPGKPERKRDAHLPSIAAPMLFVQGSRDTFGTKDEIKPVVDVCQAASLHVVEGGDHSFKVREKGTPSAEDIYYTVQNVMAEWIATL
jgi:predicted alpha/beta-hydrolase family hydrolase